MNLKYLAFAAAMAVSAPAFAATTSAPNATTDSSLQGPVSGFMGVATSAPLPSSIDNVTGASFNIGAGVYSFWLAALSEGSTTKGLFGATLYNGLGDVVQEISMTISGNTPYFAGYFTNLNLAAGTYSIEVDGAQVKGNGRTAASAGLRNDTVAVPGPEAGTGLAALAMAGVGAMVYRRKRLAA